MYYTNNNNKLTNTSKDYIQNKKNLYKQFKYLGKFCQSIMTIKSEHNLLLLKYERCRLPRLKSPNRDELL